jgi:predicted O-linked N-acetylglucosamine transferase (SPINDLY family)
LAANPDKIAAIKKHLQEKRLTSPLFDTSRFTRNLEAAYLKIADIHFAGHAPTDISISEPSARPR